MIVLFNILYRSVHLHAVFIKMHINILKCVKYAENVFCVYRNYCLFNKIQRAFIALRIIMHLLIIITHSALRSYYYICYPYKIFFRDVIYFYSSSLNAMVFITSGCYTTKKFKNLSANLHSGCIFFEPYKHELRKLQMKESLIVGFIFLFCCVGVICFTCMELWAVTSVILPKFWHRYFRLMLLFSDLRYVFEFLVLYCFLRLMSKQLELLTQSIKTSYIDECDIGDLISEVNKWTTVYNQIRENSMLFNGIFGVQVIT